jgi:hypothetical protein
MAYALKYARRERRSPEIETLNQVDRFGLEAVLGRKKFYYGEYRRLIIAENVANAFEARARSKNWAEWANQNPAAAELLARAEQLED